MPLPWQPTAGGWLCPQIVPQTHSTCYLTAQTPTGY